MNLKNNIETILGRPLTSDELNNINQFKNQFSIDEDDPLIVVLALVGANKILIEEMPKLLQQKANETIDLHRQTLITQSALIAKDLIHVVASSIDSSKSPIQRATPYLISFFLGGLSLAIALVLVR
ncbi:hypothetical protein [Methylotenera sp.]|uniref:hypothetical protein n=1 Tax=Methylotenera sp. TaxID=2051956 RepID=UPI002EDA0432